MTRQVIPTARLFAVSPPAPTPMPSSKKLIELGWDSPTPDFVHANIAQMEQRPSDGLVMRLNAGKTIFNKTAHPDSALAVDRSDLSATHFTKFSNNFVSIWGAREEGWGWFENLDWTIYQLRQDSQIRPSEKLYLQPQTLRHEPVVV